MTPKPAPPPKPPVKWDDLHPKQQLSYGLVAMTVGAVPVRAPGLPRHPSDPAAKMREAEGQLPFYTVSLSLSLSLLACRCQESCLAKVEHEVGKVEAAGLRGRGCAGEDSAGGEGRGRATKGWVAPG